MIFCCHVSVFKGVILNSVVIAGLRPWKFFADDALRRYMCDLLPEHERQVMIFVKDVCQAAQWGYKVFSDSLDREISGILQFHCQLWWVSFTLSKRNCFVKETETRHLEVWCCWLPILEGCVEMSLGIFQKLEVGQDNIISLDNTNTNRTFKSSFVRKKFEWKHFY